MAEYKKLNLDRSKIQAAIKSFPGVSKVSTNNKNTRFTVKEQEAIIQIYENTDGTTTLSEKAGQNTELSAKMAEHIVSNCTISDKKNIEFSQKDIKDEDFGVILEFLEEECGASCEIDHRQASKVYHLRANGESFTITRYNNGNTFFQGKPLRIYVAIYEILTTLDFDIVALNSSIYKISINKDDVQNDLEARLPTVHSFLCEPSKKLIVSSLVLCKIDADVGEYSCYVFGSLRAMEAFIKKLIKEKLGASIYNDLSYYFDKDTGKLKDVHKAGIKAGTIDALNGLHSFYTAHRHGLFHANGNPVAMRLIENRDEADSLIKKTLEKMEEGYNAVLQA